MRAVGWLILVLFVLAALVVGFILLISVSPITALILIGICVVVGVPAVVGIVLLVVIAESGDDGWSNRDQFFNWDTVPKMRNRWPRDEF